MILNLPRQDLPSIAYEYTKPQNDDAPSIMFCGGYRSDMQGSKATFLKERCKEAGYGFLRFDYSGHGHSGGEFDELTISNWLRDSVDVLEATINGPVYIVGSSMGGWIVLLMATLLKDKDLVQGVLGLAAAPDFTEEMFHERLNLDQQQELFTKGVVFVPNDYSDEPYRFTMKFYEDGKNNLVLHKAHNAPCPMKLIQGKQDKDVKWETALTIQKSFNLKEEDIFLIEDGDHRLSAPEHLEVIWTVLRLLLEEG